MTGGYSVSCDILRPSLCPYVQIAYGGPTPPIYICHGTDRPAIVHRPLWCDTPLYLHITIRTKRDSTYSRCNCHRAGGNEANVHPTDTRPSAYRAVNTMRHRRCTGKRMLFIFRITNEQRGDAGFVYVKVSDTCTVESRCSVFRPFVITHCKTNAICSEEPGTRHLGSESFVLLRRPITAQSSSVFRWLSTIACMLMEWASCSNIINV
jgi:hypothetical protein